MYHWILALHVIAIILWSAGVLYHFRLLSYLVENGHENAHTREVLQTIAQRLYRGVIMPSMGIAYFAGIGLLAHNPGLFKGGWLHAKLTFVLVLTVWSVFGGRLMKKFMVELADASYAGKLRLYHQVAALLMVAIVILVIVQPF